MADERDHKIIQIEKGISFGAASGSVIEITKREIEPDALTAKKAGGMPWAIWGKNNNYPQDTLDENMQDTTSAGALSFKIKAHYGKGLYFYRESVNERNEVVETPILFRDLPIEMKEFFIINDIGNQQKGIVKDYEWWEFYYMQYIPNAAMNKIVRVKWIRSKDVRLGKRDAITGEIPKYYLSALWPTPQKDQYKELPAFNPQNPFNKDVPNGLYRHQFISNDKDYYPTASWQSNKRWLAVSRKIAQWINANIDNSVNIKYHVEIPEKYFIDLYPEKNYTDRNSAFAARKAAEEQLKVDIDKCLAGADNPQKIFYTKFAIDQEGKILPGWKITALPNDIKDQAWLNADATAASRITSGHSTDPTLSGLRTGNSLQVGSGSDMREKFNFYMQLHTTIAREITLDWFSIVSRVNGWPEDIKLGYRNVMLDTLNNAKSGFQVQNEQSPTSGNGPAVNQKTDGTI
jgi:hypothetical protein